MHVTPSARLVVACLLGVAGVVALSRSRPASAPSAPLAVTTPARDPTPVRTGEGDALRDGRCVDVNRASAAELELLPGVGPRLARALVDARDDKGRFAAPSDLRAVRGVGPKTLAKLAPLLCF